MPYSCKLELKLPHALETEYSHMHVSYVLSYIVMFLLPKLTKQQFHYTDIRVYTITCAIEGISCVWSNQTDKTY